MRIFLDGQVVSGNEAEVISPRTSGQCCQSASDPHKLSTLTKQ